MILSIKRILVVVASSASLAWGRLGSENGRRDLVKCDSPNIIKGAPGDVDETIVGTPCDDIIYAYGGDDFIFADGGDDIVIAGTGNDTVGGGTGDDSIVGGDGADVLNGAGGQDTIIGGADDDIIRGGEGKDSIEAGAGNDFVSGGDNDDLINGGDGQNTLFGEDGNDAIKGGSDNDFIRAGSGSDTIEAGAGDDFVSGGDNDDSIDGGDGLNTLYGESGNDVIKGGSDNDLIRAGSGNDLIQPGYETEDDSIDVGSRDNIMEGFSDDIITFKTDPLCTLFTLVLKTDHWPQETTWDLVDRDSGDELLSGGPYGSSSYWPRVISECVTPPSGCAVFTIYDAAGDGLYGHEYPNGFFDVYWDGSHVLGDRRGGIWGSRRAIVGNCG